MGSGQTEVAGRQVFRESVTFRGHPMVRALHPTTIEVTTEDELTARGDCIIGVGADKGCEQLAGPLKTAIRRAGARVRIGVFVEGNHFVVNARGDPGLTLTDDHEMVIRRSSFLSDRTLALHADFAACDIPRPMVKLLTDPRAVGRLELEVS